MTVVPAMARPRHWSLALAGALLLHAALALAFHQVAEGGTAAGAGIGGIEIGLPPAGAAPGAAAAAGMAEPATAAEAAEVAPAAVPEAAAVPVAEAAKVPSAPADPPGAVPLYSPVEPEPVEVEAVEAEPVEPEPVEVERLEVEPEQVVAQPAMALPSPPKAKPRTPVTEAPPAAQVAEIDAEATSPHAEVTTAAMGSPGGAVAAADEPAGSNGKAGTGAEGVTGAAGGHSGGGVPGAFIDYKAQLQAWLEKHKEYPRRARLRRQEGTARLYVAFDRHGIVLEYRILESSGYKLLDEEVVAMIKRASPLPAPPAAMSGDRLDYIVPVEFFQR